jgi:hypothetical protein
VRPAPASVLRAHYQLSDSTTGTGQPPTILEPASSIDTVPILVDRPANSLDLLNRGVEVTATFPEWRAIRTRIEIQGSYTETRLVNNALDFGTDALFTGFQLDPTIPRAPYWDGVTRWGRRTMATYRLIHYQPQLGLVITATVQQTLSENTRDIGGTDTLSFTGYITRAGTLVPVAPSQRGLPQYADLRNPRLDILTQEQGAPSDWLMSLQVAKALPGDGRLSFFAFNATDRTGRYAQPGVAPRPYGPMRFGLELTLPTAPLFR